MSNGNYLLTNELATTIVERDQHDMTEVNENDDNPGKRIDTTDLPRSSLQQGSPRPVRPIGFPVPDSPEESPDLTIVIEKVKGADNKDYYEYTLQSFKSNVRLVGDKYYSPKIEIPPESILKILLQG